MNKFIWIIVFTLTYSAKMHSAEPFQTVHRDQFTQKPVSFKFVLYCPLPSDLSSAFAILLNQQAKDTHHKRTLSSSVPTKKYLRQYCVKLKQPITQATQEALQKLLNAADTLNKKNTKKEKIKQWKKEPNRYAGLEVA